MMFIKHSRREWDRIDPYAQIKQLYNTICHMILRGKIVRARQGQINLKEE